jgi:hypothetical protein
MRRIVSVAVLSVLAFSSAEAGAPSIAAPALHAGDSWVFDRTREQGTSGFARQRLDLKIDRVDSDMMVVGVKLDGAPTDYQEHMTGLDWSQRRIIDGKEATAGRPFSFPMTVGGKWESDYSDPIPHGVQTSAHFHTTYRAVGWEDVVVPAGTFHTLKIEAEGTVEAHIFVPATAGGGVASAPGGSTAVARTTAARSGIAHLITHDEFYYAPEVKYFVKSVEEQYNASNIRTLRDAQELVSYKVG